jgi:hypothetical protein
MNNTDIHGRSATDAHESSNLEQVGAIPIGPGFISLFSRYYLEQVATTGTPFTTEEERLMAQEILALREYINRHQPTGLTPAVSLVSEALNYYHSRDTSPAFGVGTNLQTGDIAMTLDGQRYSIHVLPVRG